MSTVAHRPSLRHSLYVRVAGRHPKLRVWHHQYLAGRLLYDSLPARLEMLSGRVLDVGCGYKPYRDWVPRATEYVGIDVFDGPEVDDIIVPGEPWPVADGSFDAVICTQVFEHVADLEFTVGELARALRSGGEAIVTVPFIFGEHNAPHDYRRLSIHGAREALDEDFEIVEVVRQGGIGSTLGVMLLEWGWASLPKSKLGLAAFAPFLPAWLAACVIVNVSGRAWDRIDRTGLFYGNVLLRVRRRGNA